MNLVVEIALPGDATIIASVRNEAALHLSSRFGKGHWSYQVTERGVRSAMEAGAKVLVAKDDNIIKGTFCLTTKKPWSIDPGYFTRVTRPLYLVDMAVHPEWQGKGVGRFMLEKAKILAASWPADSIRLDAYDSAAGAGEFYRKCGFMETGHVVYRNNPLIYFEWLPE